MVQIQEHASLKTLNTFGMDVRARALVVLERAEDLAQVLDMQHRMQVPLLILGGGSNVLFAGDYPGIVLLNRLAGFDAAVAGEAVTLTLGGGETWHSAVMRCVAQDWGGMENMSLIPGTAGAAPIQNIGAYGAELKDIFGSLTALNLETGEKRHFSHTECAFGYRDSVFKRAEKGRWLISAVTLHLRAHAPVNLSYAALTAELEAAGVTTPGIRDVAEAVIRVRQSKLPDPAEIGNAGSFFKNPEIPVAAFEGLRAQYPAVPSFAGTLAGHIKVPAGWLIEQAGWKGHRRGACGVHARQALVLVNYGGASGADLWQLSEDIVQSVQDRYGITLEREVNVIRPA